MLRIIKLSIASGLALSAGCASIPDGPGIMVLPGTGVPFEQFRADDVECRQYAFYQVGGKTPNQAAMKSGITSAAVGTALGAAAGAAIGGGSGAAIGAGTGLAGGGIVGSGAASSSMYSMQDRYDIAYIQCMYSKGHQVPVSGKFTETGPVQPAAPSTDIPPPPSGSPPPPPNPSP